MDSDGGVGASFGITDFGMERKALGLVDYLVFGAVLSLSAGIGIFYAIRDRLTGNNNSDTYLMGGRKLPIIPVTLSLLVSFQSAILVLGESSEIYTKGSTFWWHNVGISLSALLTCFIFVPIFYRLRLVSVYEYLEIRFQSKLVRKVASGLYLLVTIVYLSIAIYAPSVALNAVSNLPLWSLILSCGGICTFYTTIGGMKAIVWTDAIQAGFMFAGLMAVAVMGTVKSGGVANVMETGYRHGRLIPPTGDLDPFVYMTVTGVVVGQMFSWFGWYGINQSSVQRYTGMRTQREGQLALLLNIPILFIVDSLVCFCGLVMFTYYFHCDPLTAGYIKDRDQLMPYFVLEVLNRAVGIPGLFVACLFSGTLSTVSSGLNSMAAVLWEDFIKDSFPEVSDKRAVLINKTTSFVFGFLASGLSFLAPYLGGVLQAALSIMGAINGPLTGVFLLGALFPWANKAGAISGAVVSSAFLFWLCIGSQLTKPHSGYLPTLTDQCPAGNNTMGHLMTSYNNQSSVLNNSFSDISLVASSSIEKDAVQKLYSISYVLYDMIGIIIVFLIGIPTSCIAGFKKLPRSRKILFTPIVFQFWELVAPAGFAVDKTEEDQMSMKTSPTYDDESLETELILQRLPAGQSYCLDDQSEVMLKDPILTDSGIGVSLETTEKS